MGRYKTFDENAILHKAVELFWRKGYNATSIQDLVDHLGLNRSSIYETFGGKRALFEQAFEQYQHTNMTQLREFLRTYPEVREGPAGAISICRRCRTGGS